MAVTHYNTPTDTQNVSPDIEVRGFKAILDESEHAYPDYHFQLDSKQIVEDMPGHRATTSRRVSAVIKALADTCGDEYTEVSQLEARERAIKRNKQYLGQTVLVAVQTRFGVENVRQKKRDIADEYDAAGSVLSELVETNHPVGQVLTHVRDNFKELEPKELTDLVTEVIVVTHWDAFKAKVEESIATRRQTVQ